MLCRDSCKALAIDDPDVPAVGDNQPLSLETGNDPAHGLELHAEIAADLAAGQAQLEFRWRIAVRLHPRRDVEQEHRHALVAPHPTEQ